MNDFHYFRIRHSPDRDEGKGLQDTRIVSIGTSDDDIDILSALVNDYCHKHFGNQVTTAWGCTILNWEFTPITPEYFHEVQAAGFKFMMWNGMIVASYRILKIVHIPDMDRVELEEMDLNDYANYRRQEQ
jgi:hypothetical protein